MSLQIASLNSGSNANCYYVGNQQEGILVDAGLSCRETELRLKRLGLNIKHIKALFISHEHSDHIRGARQISEKHKLPIYITEATRQAGKLKLSKDLAKSFCVDIPVQIGELMVRAFTKAHDAADPHSFMVSYNEINVGVFTDIGRTCSKLITHFQLCHAAFLESNYDEEMLEKGKYPYFLKNRIRNGQGHLSNREAMDLFIQHRSSFMTHILLSHLSENNNCPQKVFDLFSSNAGGVNIVVASRYAESALFDIELSSTPTKKLNPSSQLSLEF